MTVSNSSSFLDIDWSDEDGNTELHLAANNCDEKLVQELVHRGANVNAKNKDLETPLHAAAAAANHSNSCFVNIIKILIQNGADVFALEREADCTFLHFLLFEGSFTLPQFNEIALFLIEHNYSKLFDYPGRSTGQTPLMWALNIVEVPEAILSSLHKHNVDFNAVDHSGTGVLAFAVEGKRSLSLISSLIKFGADWRHLDNNLRSLLHVAAVPGHLDAVYYFRTKLDLDVNHQDSNGDTPLHRVAQLGNENILEIVTVLIENGAIIKRNKQGLTPMAIVLTRSNMIDKNQVVELLADSE